MFLCWSLYSKLSFFLFFLNSVDLFFLPGPDLFWLCCLSATCAFVTMQLSWQVSFEIVIVNLSRNNLFESTVNPEHRVSFALTKIFSRSCQCSSKITSRPATVNLTVYISGECRKCIRSHVSSSLTDVPFSKALTDQLLHTCSVPWRCSVCWHRFYSSIFVLQP